MKIPGLLVVAVLALTGCGQVTTPSSDAPTSSHTTATQTATPTPSPSTTTTTSPAPTMSLAPAPAFPVVAGILFKQLDEVKLPVVDPQECIRQGEDPTGFNMHAFRVGPDAIACVDSPSEWQGRIIDADIFFPQPVNQATAYAVAKTVLPDDLSTVGTWSGHNNENSTIPAGGCLATGFTSASLGAATTAVKPDWGQPDSLEEILYSGQQTAQDGSSTSYDPSHVHMVGILGGDPRSVSGEVIC